MDMNLLPTHLRPLAADPARDVDSLTMTLRCPCGCTRFRLEEAAHSVAEQAAIDEWHAAAKEARKGHIVRFRRKFIHDLKIKTHRDRPARRIPAQVFIIIPSAVPDPVPLRIKH